MKNNQYTIYGNAGKCEFSLIPSTKDHFQIDSDGNIMMELHTFTAQDWDKAVEIYNQYLEKYNQ